MTLAGTRPPTVDEWDKYELHHRARLATKPGLTGMWQVSGRSNITDFEEVVKLDKQYISDPKLLVTYHRIYHMNIQDNRKNLAAEMAWRDEAILDEIREAGYEGYVVNGKDLDVF